RGGAAQRQILEPRGENVGDRALDRVGAGRIRDLVAGVVDDIEIVAGAPIQAVGARATDQRVVAGAAGKRVRIYSAVNLVVGAVAREIDGFGAGEGIVLDVGQQSMRGERQLVGRQ